jgi:hypothetical protein
MQFELCSIGKYKTVLVAPAAWRQMIVKILWLLPVARNSKRHFRRSSHDPGVVLIALAHNARLYDTAMRKPVRQPMPDLRLRRREKVRQSPIYAAVPAMIDALWPPKPKLLLITVRSLRSRGSFGV